MHRRHRLSVTILSLSLVFSCEIAPAQAPIDDRAFLEQLEKTFEQGGNVPAKDFLPGDWMQGNLHMVRPLAFNDGLNNTYFLESPAGVLEVTGTPALLVRIRE